MNKTNVNNIEIKVGKIYNIESNNIGSFTGKLTQINGEILNFELSEEDSDDPGVVYTDNKALSKRNIIKIEEEYEPGDPILKGGIKRSRSRRSRSRRSRIRMSRRSRRKSRRNKKINYFYNI